MLQRYGPDARKPGTFAANCILARRLAERGSGLYSCSIGAGTSTASVQSRSQVSAATPISRQLP